MISLVPYSKNRKSRKRYFANKLLAIEKAVSDFLKELAHLALTNAPDGSGFLSPIAFKNNWITEARKLLSISLARCNALIVEEAIIKSRGHKISSKHYASTRMHEHFHFV